MMGKRKIKKSLKKLLLFWKKYNTLELAKKSYKNAKQKSKHLKKV